MSVNSCGLRPAPPGQDSGTLSCINFDKSEHYTAVPRRSSGKDSFESLASKGEMLAPLGFEPEGSASKPNFCERASPLLEYILDPNGYATFREYLCEHDQETLLDFWRSCEEFRQLASTGSNLSIPKANATYSNYLQSKLLCARIIQGGIRAKIKHKLHSGQPLNDMLFDQAQESVLRYMNDIHYEMFLTSDIYKSYISKERVSRFESKCMPALPEEKIQEKSNGSWIVSDANTPPLGRNNREGYVPINIKIGKAALARIAQQPAPPAVSANHSDVQSLSSDALTDDSKSTFTDLSDRTSKSMEKQMGFQDVAGFVPRTKRVTKASKQLPPKEFAEILTEKLKRVEIERAQEERSAINLAGLPEQHPRRSKKSILEDAAERHQQYQKFGGFGYGLPLPKFIEPCYNMPTSSTPPHYPRYVKQQQCIPCYYPAIENCPNAVTSWQGPESVMEKPPRLGNGKKHWESVGTIESAPDSGVIVEEDISLHPETRNRIHQWMAHSEPHRSPLSQYHGNPLKQPYTSSGLPATLTVASVHMGDPTIKSLAPHKSQTNMEEMPRRSNEKELREKRSKTTKNRSYPSNKITRCQFPVDITECSSSLVSGEYKGIYSSSSVLSSVPSTVNSNDSGVGRSQDVRGYEGTKIVYFLDGEKYPYQSILPDKTVTLRQFKELIAFKKGNYRYFFKTPTLEEDCRAIYQEIKDDNCVLPCYGDKIVCKVKESKHS